jgi:DNA gyrase/topoisomerase IV subunit B
LAHLIVDSTPGRYWSLDAGVGIPVGKQEFEDERGRKEKLSTLYVVTGLTHAGANFDSDVISRGTHGIGMKATNAMSKVFTVWTFRDGAWWCIEYRDAKLYKEPYKTKAPKLPHGIKTTKGTVTLFEPDMSLFQKGSKINLDFAATWCQLTAYLVKGLTIKLTNAKGKTKTYVTKGPAEFLEHRIEENKASRFGKPFLLSSREADIAIAFTDYEGADNVECYTNGLRNKEGGEHLRALYAAMVKSLDPYKGRAEYTPSDLREGLIGLVNYKIAAPKFNNQPKDKLVDERVYEVAYPQF